MKKHTAESSVDEQAESGEDSLSDQLMIDAASILNDFLDEEAVDNEGGPIGTLACYWESGAGLLVFLGIKLNGQESVRVVPGRHAHINQRHSCIQLGFDAVDVGSAPCFDCDRELDAPSESAVCEHFRVHDAQPHGGLKHRTRQTGST